MLSVHDLLLGVLLPALLAGALLVILRRLRAGWPGALAIGGGCIAGHIGLRGWRGWVPRESTDWILVIAAAATVLASVLCARGELRPRQRVLRPLLMWASSAVAAWCLLRRLAGDDGAGQTVEQALKVGALIALFWSVAQNGHWPGRAELPCVLLFAGLGVAVTVGLSGSQSLAQHAGAVTAALGGAVVAALCGWAPRCWDGATAVASLVLGSLALAGHTFADLPGDCAVLVAAGPLAYLIARRVVQGAAVRGPVAWLLPFVAQLALIGWAVQRALAASPSFEGL